MKLKTLLLLLLTLVWRVAAVAVDLPRSCGNQSMSSFMYTGNATDAAPDKIYKFDSIRAQVLADIDKPNPNLCMGDFYRQALAEESEYWGQRLIRSGCTVSESGEIGGSCPDAAEARRSTAYVDNLNKELKAKAHAKIEDAEIARDNAAIAAANAGGKCLYRNDPATAAIAETNEHFCCGSNDPAKRRDAEHPEVGMIGTAYEGINFQTC